MQRPPNVPSRPSTVPAPENPAVKTNSHPRAGQDSVGSFWDMLGIRIIFTAICVAAGFHFRPFSVSKEYGSAVGLLFALGADALIALETSLPVRVTAGTGFLVCLLTLGMCILAGWIAIRRVAVADPAALY